MNDADPKADSLDVIATRERSIGDLVVRRVLPAPHRRHVGPFVFLDHMGPIALPPGQGMDVLPHPHVGLSTVTYLYEGEILHRDSLGSRQLIRPGDVNWMTAGRGIVHSERTGEEERRRGPKLHGLQLWVALPASHEETEPAFSHHPAESLPVVTDPGVSLRVIAGSAFGATSPVHVLSPLFYVDAIVAQGSRVALPDGHEERAAYVATGEVRSNGRIFEAGRLLVFLDGATPELEATADARLALMGGSALGERHMYWNFVATSKERIERAKADWRQGRFPLVPGDEHERTPLPDD